MNFLIATLTIISFVFSVIFKTADNLSAAAVTRAGEAIQLIIKLAGGICFWSGMMRVAQKSGVCDCLSKLLYPVLHIIFPKIDRRSHAMHAITMNVSANLLGLGNAATPFGIMAMKELHILNNEKKLPSNETVCFAVINASSIQLIPTTLAVLRTVNGSQNPMDVLPAIVICSSVSVFVGLFLAKIIPYIWRKK